MTRIQFPKAREDLTLLTVEGLHLCICRNEIFLFLVNTTQGLLILPQMFIATFSCSLSKGQSLSTLSCLLCLSSNHLSSLKLIPHCMEYVLATYQVLSRCFSSVDVEFGLRIFRQVKKRTYDDRDDDRIIQ